MTTSSPHPEKAGGRTSFVVAAVVVGLIVLLGAALAVKGIFGSDEPSSSPAPTAGNNTPAVPAEGGSLCGLDAVKESGSLTKAPTNITWDLVHTVALPTSKKAGPGKTEKGLRYCYSRTPGGAVLMALGIWVWSAEIDQELILERQIASGPGSDAAREEIRNSPKVPSSSAGDFTYQIRGFKVLHYDGKTALIDTAVQTGAGEYMHMRAELVWEKGDWRLRLAPDGGLPEVAALPDLTGFVSFYGA